MRKKKWLSVLIAAVMTIALLPAAAFAAGGEASADGVEYATLAEALEAGGNVELLRDVEVSSTITVTKPTVLNLGSYTITNRVEDERPICVDTQSFTVNGGSGGMEIPAENTNALGFIKVVSVSDFTVNGGTYTGNTKNGAFFRFEGPASPNVKLNTVTATTNNNVFYTANTFQSVNVQVNGGTYTVGTRAFLVDVFDYEDSPVVFNGVAITADSGPCIELSGGNSVLTDCIFTVTGDFTGGNTWSRAAIGVGYDGRVTVKSGTYTANGQAMGKNEGYGVYIYSSGGEVKIEGGAFAGATASLRADVDKNTYGSPAVIRVTGGNFEGDILAATNTGLESIVIEGGEFTGITEETLAQNNRLSVSGGSFDNTMKEFVGSNLKFERNSNGTYTYHETLQDAMKDAPDNTVITAVDNSADAGNAYTATLVYNDGSNKTVRLVADADGKITLPGIERGGYLFLGWDDGSGQPIAAGESYTLTQDKTLTGLWQELTKIKTEAKAATCTQDGNIAYWYCPELKSYFSDEGLTQSIRLEDTVVPATGHRFVEGECTVCGAADESFDPVITEGANGVFSGQADGLTFCSNASYRDFLHVLVDGKQIAAQNYTVGEGSTIVTLKAEYLKTLTEGKHTLAIVSETGAAETEFTIAAGAGVPADEGKDETTNGSPQTGEEGGLWIWIALAVVSSAAGVAVLTLRRASEQSGK